VTDLRNMPKAEVDRRRARALENRTLVALMARRSVIVGELVKLSHQGWDHCKAVDWQPLEDELRRIDARCAELESKSTISDGEIYSKVSERESGVSTNDIMRALGMMK